MEVQLKRVKDKRKDRIETERQNNRLYGGKAREIRQGERKKDQLKREIEEMWSELENTYSNNAVTKLENDLKAEKGNLLELYNDTQGQA